ncbi:hypothetical protein ACIBK8_06330 [Streptomyces sp. NPDC050161]|uniref:hypothetical protein n=1 Tax=Streptomyces sp. NPDC050161 TaxID=3365604 RepID=UPI00379E3912
MKAFAATGQKVTDSSAIGSDGGPSWFTSFDAGTLPGGDHNLDSVYDVWWSFNYTTQGDGTGAGLPNQYVLGVTMDWAGMDASDGPLGQFVHQPDQILVPVFNSLKGNDAASLGSFDTAVITARGLERRIQGAKDIIESWAREINEDDSNWQGSSAGVFRAVLHGMANELDRLRVEMTNPRDFAADIDHARTQLHDTLARLYDAHTAWRGDRMAWPVNATHDALQEAMQGAHIEFPDQVNPKVTSSFGDPNTQEFWDRVQSRAKALWLANVNTRLDQPAGQHMQALNSAIGSATSAIPEQVKPMQLKMPGGQTPPGASATNPFGSQTNPFGTKPPGTSGTDQQNQQNQQLPPGAQDLLKHNTDGPNGADLDPSKGTGGDGTAPPGEGTSGADGLGGGKGEDLKAPLSAKLDGPPASGVDTQHAGGEGDKDQHAPPPGMMPPMPPRIQPPMTGTSGNKSFGGPPGTGTLGSNPSAKLIGPDGKPLTDGSGKALDVPPGSKVNANGTVTRPDGTLATDRNGHQITVPRGTKLSHVTEPPNDGSLWRERKLANNLQTPPGVKPPGAHGDMEHPPAIPRGLKTVSGPAGMGGGSGEGGGIGRNSALNEATPPRTGMSPKALKSGGSIPPEEMPPGGRLARGAAQEATAMGRATSSGSPMVPPMGGGGAGAGAGGGQGGERQRQTWVDEEEEVWGTDEGTTPGVIGR